MKNGDHAIGLFQGMFDKNILTFNPGWSSDAQPLRDGCLLLAVHCLLMIRLLTSPSLPSSERKRSSLLLVIVGVNVWKWEERARE